MLLLQAVGFLWGYICQQFVQTIYILGAGIVLASLVSRSLWWSIMEILVVQVLELVSTYLLFCLTRLSSTHELLLFQFFCSVEVSCNLYHSEPTVFLQMDATLK